MPAYRLPSPYDRPPLKRRASGLALAVAVNVGLLLVLLTLGVIPLPERKPSNATVVDFIPEAHSLVQRTKVAVTRKLAPKRPPVVLPPVKRTITPPEPLSKAQPWLEMSKEEMAAADISKLGSAGGDSGDSAEVGRGPHGEVLYAAEWARHPTNAELGGYLPKDAPDGYGLVACRTIPDDRVDDCVELESSPLGSHLARAVRLAAWQFRVRPPRKGGKALVGSWVRIEIDYEHVRTGGGE